MRLILGFNVEINQTTDLAEVTTVFNTVLQQGLAEFNRDRAAASQVPAEMTSIHQNTGQTYNVKVAFEGTGMNVVQAIEFFKTYLRDTLEKGIKRPVAPEDPNRAFAGPLHARTLQ